MAFENYKRRGHVLYPGDELHANECLVSTCGKFYVCLQPDGNFVQYRWTSSGREASWTSRTHFNTYGYDRCVLRWGPRGQIVLQDNVGGTYWNMLGGAQFNDHPSELVIQTDSNFVYYTNDHKAVWSSRCHSHSPNYLMPDCRVVSIVQKDSPGSALGQLVLESGYNHALVKFNGKPEQVVLPNTRQCFTVPAGTLQISTITANRFDANGKLLHEVDSVVATVGIAMRPGETQNYDIQAGNVVS
jgi:hypothetical protein